MKKRWPDTIVLLAVAGVCITLWQPLWSASRTLYLWDAGTYFFPMKEMLSATVQAGEWPWWNPWIRNGLPFYANPQVGLFYPASLLFYFLPTALAFNWNVMLHTILMASGFFLWLRSSGRSPAAAALGALAIAWGGYALSMTIYLNNLQALAWIGWTWWAWGGWLHDRSWRWLALTSAGFALEFLAGEPQVAVVTAVVALLLAWQHSDDRRARLAPLLGLGAAAVGAMVLTAIQLVPTLELFRESQRSLGLTAKESLGWSLAPAHLYNLVVPRYFEAPSGLFDLRRIPGLEQPWVFTSYLGVVVVSLAAVAVDLREGARGLLWPLLGAAGVFLALGTHNPVVAAVAEAVPGLRVFRFPEKMLLLPAIAVPVLAAIGLDRVHAERRARLPALAALALIAVIGGVGWAVADVEALEQGFRHVVLFAVLAGLVLLAVKRLSFPVLAALLVGIAIADLASVNTQVSPVAAAELYAERPAVLEGLPIERLRTRSRIRTSPLGEPPGLAFTMAGIASGTNQYYQMQGMGGNLAMAHRVLAVDGAEPFPPRTDDAQDAILRQLPIEQQVRYLRLQSTEWLIERGMNAEGLRLDAPIEGLGLFRYRLSDPLPRAYLVGRVEVEPDSIAVLNRFLAGGENPHAVAYVSEAPGLDGPGRVGGSVRWLEGSNHSVRVEVDAPARSLLVLTDTWYPGWRVSVDGRPAPIRRVNWHFKGVYVEPGTHRVRFDYRPRGLVPAAIVSALALAGLIGVVIVGGRRGA